MLSLVALSFSYVLRADESSHWNQILKQAEAGNLQTTLEILNAHPEDHPLYYYNLGTAHLLLKDPVLGAAYLEKARRSSRDPDLIENLGIASQSLSHPSEALNWLEQLSETLLPPEALTLLLSLSLAIGIFWLYRSIRFFPMRESLFHPLNLSLGCFLFGLSGIFLWGNRYPTAFVTKNQVIRSGPGDSFLKLGELPPGSKVKLLGENQTWKQIRYASGAVGWISTSGVVVL